MGEVSVTFHSKKPTETKETVYDIGSTVFGKWRITKFIGKGSFGRVFKIDRIDGLLSESSALKVITVPRDDEELQNLRVSGMSTAHAKKYLEGMTNDVVREIRIMSDLKGTANIVSYEDCEKIPHANGVGWDILIRMELLNPLLRYACEHPFSRRDIIKLGIDICRALELCQKNNTIHRDVKPENIFVSRNGDFKLGDFGIARSFEHTAAASTKVGTCNYMAPEVFHGERYGFTVDTYSLGIILYRLLNKNRLPFLPTAPQGFMPLDQEAALARRMAGEPVPSPYYFQGRLPEIVLRACAPDVEKRFSSPAEMRRALEAIKDDPCDAEIIFPDEDTLENLREIYFPKYDTEPIASPAPSPSESNQTPRPDGTAKLFFIDPSEPAPAPPPPPPEPNPSPRPGSLKKPIGLLAAVGVCAVAAAAGLFMILHGRNVTDAGEVSAPPSQSSDEPSLSVSQSASVSPSPSALPSPLQATPETDFQIENGVLVKYIGSGGDVVIPDSVTSIGFSAFRECMSLTSVIIPDSVTSIEGDAFWNCTGLTSVTIPDSVASIAQGAFEFCSGLTSVTIPDGVKEIGEAAFNGCTGLKKVTISDGLKVIGAGTFSQTPWLEQQGEWAVVNGILLAYQGSGGRVSIPSSVTSIGKSAFEYCTGLTSVDIPGSVTDIGERAFWACTDLISVTIPDSVTSIGDCAFMYCIGLTNVKIPDSVTEIGGGAFQECSGLTSVIIPGSIIKIGGQAFGNTPWVEQQGEWVIVNGILLAYQGSGGRVTIPSTVTSIADYAFWNCDSLISVIIPDGVTGIGDCAFYGCEGLASTAIPDSVTSIGRNAFDDCIRLTSVTIPDSVTSIGWSAFSGCTDLTNISIPDGVTSIEYGVFSGCRGLTSVTIPASVTSIGNYAFSDCTSLKEVYYGGTQATWDAITIAGGNEHLLNATIYGMTG